MFLKECRLKFEVGVLDLGLVGLRLNEFLRDSHIPLNGKENGGLMVG